MISPFRRLGNLLTSKRFLSDGPPMTLRQRLEVAASDQGSAKRVLCICDHGVARAPTAAELLSRSPYDFNTRSCGIDREACLIPLDSVLLYWADEIVVMTSEIEATLRERYKVLVDVVVLEIEDDFRFRQPELIQLILNRYNSKP